MNGRVVQNCTARAFFLKLDSRARSHRKKSVPPAGIRLKLAVNLAFRTPVSRNLIWPPIFVRIQPRTRLSYNLENLGKTGNVRKTSLFRKRTRRKAHISFVKKSKAKSPWRHCSAKSHAVRTTVWQRNGCFGLKIPIKSSSNPPRGFTNSKIYLIRKQKTLIIQKTVEIESKSRKKPRNFSSTSTRLIFTLYELPTLPPGAKLG